MHITLHKTEKTVIVRTKNRVGRQLEIVVVVGRTKGPAVGLPWWSVVKNLPLDFSPISAQWFDSCSQCRDSRFDPVRELDLTCCS